jgi:hypothetical protein
VGGGCYLGDPPGCILAGWLAALQDRGGRKETAVNDTTHGEGWVAFAGIMILIAAVLNAIWGIAAIDKASFFIEDERLILSDLSTWGWIILVIGVLQAFAASRSSPEAPMAAGWGSSAPAWAPSGRCCRSPATRFGRCACSC